MTPQEKKTLVILINRAIEEMKLLHLIDAYNILKETLIYVQVC